MVAALVEVAGRNVNPPAIVWAVISVVIFPVYEKIAAVTIFNGPIAEALV